MKYMIFVGMLLAVCVMFCGVSCVGMTQQHVSVRQNAITIYASNGDSALLKFAVEDMNNYMHKMFVNQVTVSNTSGHADIVLGTFGSNELIKKAVSAGKLRLPEGKNADQGYTIKTIDGSIYVASATEQGLSYGIYSLLEKYGAYFQISGEILPQKTAFSVKQIDISESPVFKYRGVLPWDNFSCGMSGYNIEDYQQLIDRLTRMKFNMLQFHFYPGMAFYNEKCGDTEVAPKCIGMPVDVFNTTQSIGKEVFKGEEIFGPRPYVSNIGNPLKQASEVQQMMRQVLDYAHNRGLKTCVGFELMLTPCGNPTLTQKPDTDNGGADGMNPVDQHNVMLNVDRFRRLSQIYPQSDYYWMWQSEGWGYVSRNNWEDPAFAAMREKYAYWAKEYALWGGQRLSGDIDYAYMFREVVSKLTPEERTKTATGGWTISHLFPNITKDFPQETIFASLNTYAPDLASRLQVHDFNLPSSRRAWMIDWWEFDGNQWFPQFRATWQEEMYRNCVKYGVESVTLLGWKLSAIEHNVKYMAEFSWNPNLSAKDFYKSYISKVYGVESSNLTDVYLAYDRFEPNTPGTSPGDARNMLLGAGWASLVIPQMPARAEDINGLEWKKIVDQAKGDLCGIAGQEKLLKMDQNAVIEFKSLMGQMSEDGKKWAGLMINRLEFRILYLRAVIELNKSLIEYQAGRSVAAEHAKMAVDLAKQAIEKYAEDIRNRGDQGVIVQLNEQFYKALQMHYFGLSGQDKYAVIDWDTFRILPNISFDFGQGQLWVSRDGDSQVTAEKEDGIDMLKVVLGSTGQLYNSVWIKQGNIDMTNGGWLDFKIRTQTDDSLAIMFEVSGQWYAINLVGVQGYASVENIVGINDGKWHRVTLDLKKLVKERLNHNGTISNMVIGAWKKPQKPIIFEIRDFSIGARNTVN